MEPLSSALRLQDELKRHAKEVDHQVIADLTAYEPVVFGEYLSKTMQKHNSRNFA
jgi:hypothetical protein